MKKLLFLLMLLTATQTISYAQLTQLTISSSFGASYIAPTGVTADAYDNGFGLIGTSNIEILPMLDITVVGSWSMLNGKDVYSDAQGNIHYTDDLSILGVTAGPVLKLGFLGVGVKGGYYFDDIHEWVLLPFAEVSLWKFSLGAEYKALDATKWFSAYLSYTY